MTTTGRVLPALAALTAACASSRPPTLADVQPPVAWVETLPPGATIGVNGVEVGRGPLTFPVPDPGRTYAVRVGAPGFETQETAYPGASLAGARLEIVLRPEGFGSQRPLQTGDPDGLLQAANVLLRGGRPREAVAYAQAALAAGGEPQAHRVLGLAWRKLGDRDRAVKELSTYLSLAPGAPDRREVEQLVSSMAREIDMAPAARPGR